MDPHFFFEKHQKFLVNLFNNPRTKEEIFSIIPTSRIIRENYIYKVTPNSIQAVVGFRKNKPIAVGDFFLDNRVFNKLALILDNMDSVLEGKDRFAQKILEDPIKAFLLYGGFLGKIPIFNTTTDYQADATGKGGLYKNDSTVWADTRGAVTALGSTTVLQCDGRSAEKYYLHRLFIPFNTAGMGAGATDISGIVKATASAAQDEFHPDANAFATIVESSQASNTEVVNDDFNNLGFVDHSSTHIDYGSINTDGVTFNEWTLNATGNAGIDCEGYTKKGFMDGHDLNNTAPATLTNTFSTVSGLLTNAKITVTYTPGAVAIAGGALLGAL